MGFNDQSADFSDSHEGGEAKTQFLDYWRNWVQIENDAMADCPDQFRNCNFVVIHDDLGIVVDGDNDTPVAALLQKEFEKKEIEAKMEKKYFERFQRLVYFCPSPFFASRDTPALHRALLFSLINLWLYQ